MGAPLRAESHTCTGYMSVAWLLRALASMEDEGTKYKGCVDTQTYLVSVLELAPVVLS